MGEINEKFREDALKVIEGVGGKENISSVTHCLTRLRFVLKDTNLADIKKLESIKSVKGTFTNSGQFQIIIGNNVKPFYQTMTALFDLKEVSKEESKEFAKKNMNPLERFLAVMAEIFVPLLPAVICGGLILGFRNLIGDIEFGGHTLAETSSFWKTTYDFLWLIGEAIFHFLPVGITWSVVRKMGGSQILGIVLGITLVSPQLMNAYNIGKAIPDFYDFGLFTIDKIGYQAQVIPSIFAGYVLAFIETRLNKIVHESIRVVIVPITALVITTFLAHSIIGPVGREIGDLIGLFFQIILTGKFAVFGSIIFGLLYAPLVITGVHHTTNAIEFTLVQQVGGTMIFPLIALSNISQATAVLAITLASKSVKRDISIPAAISAYLGVTEPAMYGVNIRYKYPMVCAMIGSACGAGVCGFFGIMANSVGVGGLPGILTIKPQYWLQYLMAVVVSFTITFALTFLYSKKQKD